ncbi:MAG: cyclic nucleotide-binding domain-containing protein, partial [Myxococcota bacterium]|nr:cyclic nucleotide-binding domain-containing protein [Myxococcota bacterium]
SCYLEDDLTRSYMANETLKDIPDKFIHFANECGGKDNITAVVVRILEEQERERLSERVTLVQRKTGALQANPLFQFLNYRDIVKVMNGAERRRLKSGELLVREGTRTSEMFIVLTGTLELSRSGIRIGTLEADDAIGEPTLISNAPCDVTATAVADTEVLSLTRQRLHDLMANNATLGWKLLWSLSQTFHRRLRAMDAELFRAAQSISEIAHASPSVQIEKPQLFAVSCGGVTHGFHETDELVPPFFDGTNDGGTDPIITIKTEGTASDDDDGVDEASGGSAMESLAPQDDVQGAPLSIQNTEPDLRAKDLVDLQRFGPGRTVGDEES